jgi:hypothetical protein
MKKERSNAKNFTFNKKLNALCDKVPVTNAWLASIVGVHPSHISSWRCNRSTMYSSYYYKLLSYLPPFIDELIKKIESSIKEEELKLDKIKAFKSYISSSSQKDCLIK